MPVATLALKVIRSGLSSQRDGRLQNHAVPYQVTVNTHLPSGLQATLQTWPL
jgi:hypothetical protein